MNDIGPFVPSTGNHTCQFIFSYLLFTLVFSFASGLHRLALYVGKGDKFRNLDEVHEYVKRICAPFGCKTEEEWKKLSKYYARPIDEGEFKYALHYDPAIATNFPKDPSGFKDINLWHLWPDVRCESLLVLKG